MEKKGQADGTSTERKGRWHRCSCSTYLITFCAHHSLAKMNKNNKNKWKGWIWDEPAKINFRRVECSIRAHIAGPEPAALHTNTYIVGNICHIRDCYNFQISCFICSNEFTSAHLPTQLVHCSLKWIIGWALNKYWNLHFAGPISWTSSLSLLSFRRPFFEKLFISIS